MVEHIELGLVELAEHIGLALDKQPVGQHIAQLGPRKLALSRLVVVALELDKLVVVALELNKLVVEPIAALVLTFGLELKQLGVVA